MSKGVCDYFLNKGYSDPNISKAERDSKLDLSQPGMLPLYSL